MIQEEFKETTKGLLRPRQVEEKEGEVRRLEATLNAPPHVAAQIQEPGEMRRQLQGLRRDLDSQTPRPYGDEIDKALERSDNLRTEILQGMPTKAEMRRNPAGAVDKHRKWESRNKEKILEWKNIQLRAHAGGHLDELPDAADVANFEKHRPSEASHELNMHNEQIPGRVQHGPAPGAELGTVFTDEDKALLQSVDPEISQGLALMNNEQRASVKQFIQNMTTPSEVKPTVTFESDFVPEKKGWTDERRQAASEKAKARWAAKKQED